MKTVNLLDLPGITAFSTLRNTGTPLEPYAGFSTCPYTGDSPAHYLGCREELAHCLGIETDRIVFPTQTHSLNVTVVTDPTAPLPDTDAIVTGIPGIALGIHTADCVPVVLADPKNRVIGAAHSGWRGACGEIAALTVAKMMESGAEPSAIVAAMGPCICANCFEVGEEVAEKFDRFGAVSRAMAKPHVNLPEVVAANLESIGVKRENIAMPVGCSRCDSVNFFSARKLGVASGRTLTIIMMR